MKWPKLAILVLLIFVALLLAFQLPIKSNSYPIIGGNNYGGAGDIEVTRSLFVIKLTVPLIHGACDTPVAASKLVDGVQEITV